MRCVQVGMSGRGGGAGAGGRRARLWRRRRPLRRSAVSGRGALPLEPDFVHLRGGGIAEGVSVRLVQEVEHLVTRAGG